jgi:hypothetical protein
LVIVLFASRNLPPHALDYHGTRIVLEHFRMCSAGIPATDARVELTGSVNQARAFPASGSTSVPRLLPQSTSLPIARALGNQERFNLQKILSLANKIVKHRIMTA